MLHDQAGRVHSVGGLGPVQTPVARSVPSDRPGARQKELTPPQKQQAKLPPVARSDSVRPTLSSAQPQYGIARRCAKPRSFSGFPAGTFRVATATATGRKIRAAVSLGHRLPVRAVFGLARCTTSRPFGPVADDRKRRSAQSTWLRRTGLRNTCALPKGAVRLDRQRLFRRHGTGHGSSPKSSLCGRSLAEIDVSPCRLKKSLTVLVGDGTIGSREERSSFLKHPLPVACLKCFPPGWPQAKQTRNKSKGDSTDESSSLLV